ncbi:hypothetical protein GOP47_0018508 [Adiantum capillus-veneris]|uniref:Uncharacterized protein n=1 Tax=Adiantum capillus-veneris TaxID=13818 RepID=A0A9D4UDA7_ADICA|nr:hypothetical protein GOP47_0018508 [Adiantum capillus-veneris]
MEMASTRPSPGKQLVFDCRYGWIYDEWREPATIAHHGGRGMFSIVPITVAALRKTVSTANVAADAVADVLKNPPTIKSLQSNLQHFSLKVERSLKSSCTKFLLHPPETSSDVANDVAELEDLTESLSTSSNFGEAIRGCKQKVKYKFEMIQTNKNSSLFIPKEKQKSSLAIAIMFGQFAVRSWSRCFLD